MRTRSMRQPRRRPRTVYLLTLSALLVFAVLSNACSREDTATPVATPTLTLPSGKVPAGRPAAIMIRFAVAPTAPAFAEDYVVFVHAIDERGKRIWTSDHQPPTPTRQWKAGEVIEYTHSINVPRNTPEGRVALEVGLYSTQSRDRLPLSGENNGNRAYRVGAIDVTAAAVNTSTVYVDGWHPPEAPEDAQGTEWRWSRGAATVWLRNPKSDTTLVLDLDQPSAAFTDPQHVTLRTVARELDSFDLPQGKRQTRRIPMSATDLGDSAMVRVTITVNKTFVPAELPNSGSRDTRQLGVRVFEAYLDPGVEETQK